MADRSSDYESIINGLGGCSLPGLESTLKSLSGCDSDGVALALSMLVASAPAGSHQPSWFDTAFTILSESRSGVATTFLRQAALHADNACTRLCAIRHLKSRKLGDETRHALHGYAKEGMPKRMQTFQSRNPSPEDFQIAALEALSSAEMPSESLEFVWELVRELAPNRSRKAPVYSAALDCLRQAESPSLLPIVLEAAEAERDPLTRLDLLSTCAGLSPGCLKGQAGKLRRLLVDAVRSTRPDAQIREGVDTLAAKLQSPEFLTQLVALLGDGGLKQARGKLVAAVLDAYDSPDDTLCAVCLELAASPANVERPCVDALHRCSTLYGERIFTAICTDAAPGMAQLRRYGSFRVVFDDPEEAWNVGLRALRAAPVDVAKTLGPMFTAVTLARAVPTECEDWRERHRLEEFARSMAYPEVLQSSETRKTCSQVCERYELWPVLARVVGVTVAPDAPAQCAHLLAHLLAASDELAQRIIDMTLDEAERLGCEDPEYPAEGSACESVEEQLAECNADYLCKQVDSRLVADGRLSRYVLGLCRRLGLDFYKRARQLLEGRLNTEDTVAVIRELEAARSEEGLRLICEATRHVSERGGADPVRVRAAALESIASLCDRADERLVEPDDNCMAAVHERVFHDGLEVRMKAYEACRRVVSLSSIEPLRQREKSERDPRALDMLRASLRAIRDRLRRERPPVSAVEETLVWLGHVSALGDPDLLPELTTYLCPPHADKRVLLAALGCLLAFGASEGLEVCRRFLAETSPHGEVLVAARRTAGSLAGRHDMELLDNLPWLFGADAALCDPEEHNYERLFGAPRCHTLVVCLQDCRKAYDSSDWDTFVTRADGIGHVLVKQIYETRHADMGLPEDEAAEYASRSKQQTLLNRTEFRNAYAEIRTRLQTIHELRQQARTAHAEDKDGTAKPGIGHKATADSVRSFLREAFGLTVAVLEG